MTNCQYKRLCALYSHNSLQCGIFSQRCKYHREFDWYNKETVTNHTDRIRMGKVEELEKEFDINTTEELERQRVRLIKLSGQDKPQTLTEKVEEEIKRKMVKIR